MFENLLKKSPVTPEFSETPVQTHVHEWTLIAKTVGKPHTTFNLPQAHQVTIDPKSVLGTTSYLYECLCGQKEVVVMLGLEDAGELAGIVEDCEKYGQARFTYGGRNYAVLPDTTAPQVIPVRLPVQ